MRFRSRAPWLLACAGLIVTPACAPEAPRAACEGVELLVAASDHSSSVVCGAPGCTRGPDTTGVDLGEDPKAGRVDETSFFDLAPYDVDGSPQAHAAIVAGPEAKVNPTAPVTFDPETGELLASMDAPALGPTPGYDLQGLAFRGDTLYVGDRRPDAGGYAVHVLAREGSGCALRETGRSTLLPQQPVAPRAALARGS